MSEAGIGYTLATGRLFCHMEELQSFVEALLGRPVFTHEFADPELWAEARERFEAETRLLAAETLEGEYDEMALAYREQAEDDLALNRKLLPSVGSALREESEPEGERG